MRLSELEAVAARLISGGERREEQRFAVDIPVHAVLSHPQGLSAMVRDGVIEEITPNSAALTTAEPIKRGWLVKLRMPIGSSRVELQGRVGKRRVRTTDAGTVHVHRVEFIDASNETLEALVLAGTPQPAELLEEPTVPNVVPSDASQRVSVAATPLSSPRDTMTTRNAFPPQETRATSTTPLLTVLGGSARIEGRFAIAESIEVQCQVAGELEIGDTIVIGERGEVSADISTVNAIIRGRYEGTLKASGSVEIAATAHVSGSIESNEIAIERGAEFTGSISRVAPAVSNQTEIVSVAAPRIKSGLAFETERSIPMTRVPLVDAPSSRGPVELA